MSDILTNALFKTANAYGRIEGAFVVWWDSLDTRSRSAIESGIGKSAASWIFSEGYLASFFELTGRELLPSNITPSMGSGMSELRRALERALGQWKMYYSDCNSDDLENGKHAEADMYRHCASLLTEKGPT